MMHFGNMAGLGMGFWWIGGLLLLGLFVWFLVIAFMRLAKDPFRNESPLDVLRKRYAKGEISKEGFDRLSSDLHY